MRILLTPVTYRDVQHRHRIHQHFLIAHQAFDFIRTLLLLTIGLLSLLIPSSLLAKSSDTDAHTRLAVLEFRDEAQLPTFERALLADSVRGAVLNTPFQIMTKENMLTLLPPGQTLDDCIGDCEIDVGRKLGAHYVITGMIGRIDGDLQLLLRLYETQNGNLKGQSTVSATTVTQLQVKVARAAVQILEQVKPSYQMTNVQTRTLLFIEYKPKHASIKIDGHQVNMNQVKKVNGGILVPVDAGRHKVEVSAKGYIRMQKRVEINTGQPHQVSLKLSRSYRNKACYTGACSADLFVYTKPAGAKIYLNGKSTGKVTKVSPHNPSLGSIAFSVPAGKYWVSARKKSYKSAEKFVELKAGDTYNQFRHNPLRLTRPRGRLKITSQPSGALVRLNGVVVGKTPFERKRLQAKPYWLELMAEGYQSKEKLIMVKAGRRWKEHWQLNSVQTTLTVNVKYKGKAVPGASLWINDEMITESDEEGNITLKEIPHGTVDLQIRHPLYVAYHDTFQLGPGQKINKRIYLKGAFAYLKINHPKDVPIQHVLWAGQKLDESSTQLHKVPAGSYWLQVRPQDEERWQPYRRRFTLKVGETKTITPRFNTYRAWLKIKSKPKGAQVYLDQKAVGKTPIRIKSTTGTHRLKVLLAGHVPYQKVIRLKKGSNFSKIDFSRRTVLDLSCFPSQAMISVDGESIGYSPQQLDSTPGQHEVSCALGMIERTKTVDIARGTTQKVYIQLDPNLFKKARQRKTQLAWVGKGMVLVGLGGLLTAGTLWAGPTQSALEERDRYAQSWLSATAENGRISAYQSWSVADQQARYYDQWAQRTSMISAIISAVGAGIWGYAHYSKPAYPTYSTKKSLHISSYEQ